MKIIIAGAGAVGSHLAQLLSKDNHDIVIIDESQQKTDALTANGNCDLMVFNAPPSNISILKEAGTQHANLFIAVTPDESRNLTCCMIAHTLGAKKTVARVDNPEYVEPQNMEIFKNMGVDSIIYPESLAAKEILQAMHHSWVRQYWEVHNGALVMLGIKLRETAQILNVPLKDLCPAESPYHIVAIKRDDTTLIPSGDTCLELGDIAYFMTTKKYISYIRELVGKEHYADVRDTMVMGGGPTTIRVALGKPDWINMKVIEENTAVCHHLNDMLENDDVIVLNADARDTTVLAEEGLGSCQAFAALSPDTESNVLACLAAKRMGVRKTIAMVENLDYVSMAEKLDIGSIINKKTIAASHIYQMLLDADVASVKCLTISNAEVAEFIASEDSPICKKLVRELKFPQGVTLGGLVRGNVGMAINGNTQILPGDSVVVFAIDSQIKKIDKFFRKQDDGIVAKILKGFAPL